MKHAMVGLSVLLALSASAGALQAAIPIPPPDEREASFLPPPVPLAPAEGVAQSNESAPKVEGLNGIDAGASVALPAPSGAQASEAPLKLSPPPVVVPPAQAEQPAPVAAQPASIPPASAQPAVPAPTEGPKVELPKPVTAAPLAKIDPESTGLLDTQEGGLGASLWQGTSRAVVDRLMPALHLPTDSPVLNDVARRMLLTTAAVPTPNGGDGKEGRSLTSLRMEKLLALGDVVDAWKLATLVDADRVDEVSLRMVTEASLIGPESKEVCEKIPALMAGHALSPEIGAEWQKSLLVCQLRAGDMNAVQLGLDLMREQKVKDDVFMTLMNRNVLAQAKVLPRQLTPLRPMNLALLRQINMPLPPELYARPEASMVAELLLTKGSDDKARLSLAERSAASGIISPQQLEAVYKSILFTAEEIASAGAGVENGPRGRALLAQMIQKEAQVQKKIDMIHRLVADVSGRSLTGALGGLVAEMLKDIPPEADYNVFSAQAARLLVLAGKPDKAMAWYKLAGDVADRLPDVAAQLNQSWPIFALSGLVSDGAFAPGLKKWLASALVAGDEGNDRARRELAGNILLLLSAAGHPVPEEAWDQVTTVMTPTKKYMPSPVLVERLRQAAQAGRRGEAILLALTIVSDGVGETQLGVTIEVVRALRQVGLMAESRALAREAAVGLMAP